MALRIETIVLGPLENNSYLLSDIQTRQALVIDPSFNISKIIARINEEALTLKAVWLTHGHFDHFAGASQLIHSCPTPVEYLIHEKDYALWQAGGEGRNLGFSLDLRAAPNILLKDDQVITFESNLFTVLPTPGHTAGHVTYYNAPHAIAFCGDLIFRYSIGRTDLNGGDYGTLMTSIRTKITTMPPDTTLFSGHGGKSTVREQIRSNPFLTSQNQQPGSLE